MTDRTRIDDFRWLTGPEASPWLELAAQSPKVSARLMQTLRKDLTVDRAQLVAETTELRRRAEVKFSRASQMFFTRKLLEQATEESIADYKAARFSPAARIADICCGIGGDALGLARQRQVVLVDCDPVATLLAERNTQVNDGLPTEFVNGDAESFAVGSVDAIHIDPDRRTSLGRTIALEQFQPSLAAIEQMLATNGNMAVKTAPATSVPDDWSIAGEREWIGSRRECRQQMVWLGNLARQPGARMATVIDRNGRPTSFTGDASVTSPNVRAWLRFVHEPHAAVLAAGIDGDFAQQHDCARVDSTVPYYTSDQPFDSPLIASFEILEVLPYDLRKLRTAVAVHNGGTLEVKVRGVLVKPSEVIAKIRPRGSSPLTILLSGSRSSTQAIVARRPQPASSPGRELD